MDLEEFNIIQEKLIRLLHDNVSSIEYDGFIKIGNNRNILVEDNEYVLLMDSDIDKEKASNLITHCINTIYDIMYSKTLPEQKRIKGTEKILDEIFDIRTIDEFNKIFSSINEIQTGGPIFQRFLNIHHLSTNLERELYFYLANVFDDTSKTLLFSDHNVSISKIIKNEKNFGIDLVDRAAVLNSKKIKGEMGWDDEKYSEIIGGGFIFFVDGNSEFFKYLVDKRFIIQIKK